MAARVASASAYPPRGNSSSHQYDSRSTTASPSARDTYRHASYPEVNSSPSSKYSYQSSHNVYTPESSANLGDSLGNLSLHDRSRSTEPTQEEVESQEADDDVPIEPLPQLQYHHQLFQESPRKKDKRGSQATLRSVNSASSGEQGPQVKVQRASMIRPSSQNTLGTEMRANSHTPLSTEDSLSVPGSPQKYARHISGSRRSPDNRPMSYVDLLNEVPYSQQIAPAPSDHFALQMAVGNNASLLDTRKTLEMYRANVKKTTDAAVQYEFAIFMVNTAREMAMAEAVGARPDSPQGGSAADMIKEARTILQRLSDRAYPFAQYYLADGYFSGFFNKDKPDYDKAFPLFVAASKHGHAEAGYRAALCYEFGWGCTKSYPKAVQFFRNAASKGHPGAAVRLGKACLTGDMGLHNRYREGVKWLKRATESADMQYNSGPYELGILHLTGYGDDIFKDEAYAAQLLTQAAELGHPEANFRMGQAYENGLLGCPRDAALSVHFYNGAAMRGMPEAMMALCAWYMVGAEPVLEKDEAEAFEWARKAAESGLPKAEYAVGYFTEMGIGCRRDALEANVWYVKAAEKGNETAAQRLAIIRAAASGDPGIPMGKAKPKAKELGGKEKDCIVM